ncbi:MAG: molecular chaperone GrpE [Oscillospiraceae bacterium]|nr:molecular chaperone GrpE [Oscillospiraceae bacterium]
MFIVYICVFALVCICSLVFRIASVLRLGVPLLYALIAPTLFHGWFASHPALANGIGWALLALCGLSWVLSLISRLRELALSRRDDRAALAMFERRVRLAKQRGEAVISTEGLYRD